MDAIEEFVTAVFAPVNLPYTVALGVFLLYWVSVLMGALDIEAFDFDIDLDADVDVDVDIDADVDGAAPSGGWLRAVLQFLYAGEVPIMIPVSVAVLSMWTISILANYYLGNSTGWVAVLIFVPNLVASAFVARTAVRPLRTLFRSLNTNTEETVEILGKICRVSTSKATGEFGQAEVTTDGAPLLLNVRTRDGGDIPRGTEAIIVGKDEEKDVYLIRRF